LTANYILQALNAKPQKKKKKKTSVSDFFLFTGIKSGTKQ